MVIFINVNGREWEGWEETELGSRGGLCWVLPSRGVQVALPCVLPLSLSFPGGCAGFGAPLHLGTLSADGAGEVSSALPSHLPPLALG